jgi:hypothetical protein
VKRRDPKRFGFSSVYLEFAGRCFFLLHWIVTVRYDSLLATGFCNRLQDRSYIHAAGSDVKHYFNRFDKNLWA